MSLGRDYSSLPCVSTLPVLLAVCFTADSIPTERKLTRMKTNSLFRSVALLAAIALAVPVFAKPFTKTINIAQAAKVATAGSALRRPEPRICPQRIGKEPK